MIKNIFSFLLCFVSFIYLSFIDLICLYVMIDKCLQKYVEGELSGAADFRKGCWIFTEIQEPNGKTQEGMAAVLGRCLALQAVSCSPCHWVCVFVQTFSISICFQWHLAFLCKSHPPKPCLWIWSGKEWYQAHWNAESQIMSLFSADITVPTPPTPNLTSPACFSCLLDLLQFIFAVEDSSDTVGTFSSQLWRDKKDKSKYSAACLLILISFII